VWSGSFPRILTPAAGGGKALGSLVVFYRALEQAGSLKKIKLKVQTLIEILAPDFQQIFQSELLEPILCQDARIFYFESCL
jgi:hypothetical protein